MAESLSEKRKVWPKAKKKKARKEKEAEGLRKKNEMKAQSANVCQRHSAKRKERKHKVLVKKIEKKRDM